jgi:hypothetical protein
MMINGNIGGYIAIYAAVVATSALLLNFKSWFDSGVKLRLGLMVDAVVIGDDPDPEEKDLIVLTVTNRGDAATTIKYMLLFEMPWWERFRLRSRKIRPTHSYVIPNPQLKGSPANTPSLLEPAKQWTGALRKRDDLDLRTGKFYTGVYASNRDRPYLIRIPKNKDVLPPGTTKLERASA